MSRIVARVFISSSYHCVGVIAFLKTEKGATWREANVERGERRTVVALARDDELLAEGAAGAKKVVRRETNRETAKNSKKRKAAELEVYTALVEEETQLNERVAELEERLRAATVDGGGPAALSALAPSAEESTLRAELEALQREYARLNDGGEFGGFIDVVKDADDAALLVRTDLDKADRKNAQKRMSGRRSRARKSAKLAKVPILKQHVAMLTRRVAMLEEDLRAATRAPELTAPPPAAAESSDDDDWDEVDESEPLVL